MLKIADFRAFYRVFRRTIFASVLCFIALFSSSFAASQHWVKYRSYDAHITRLLGGSNSGYDANGYTYEDYNFNAWLTNHRANLDNTYTVLDMIPFSNTSAIRFSYYCSSGICDRGPNTGGYHFTGKWRGNYRKDGTPGDEEYTPGETFTYKVDGDLILEAIMKPNKYTVTYNCGSFSYNGYTTLNAIPISQNQADYEVEVIFDQPYQLKTAQDVAHLCYPPAQDYVFKGWNCRGENWLYDGSYPIDQYFSVIIGESGDHWRWGNVECSALWGPDSKSSVIHLVVGYPFNQYPVYSVSYTPNSNASYNTAQLGKTELLAIKNTGVYIDLDAQYEMTPVGGVNGGNNPVAIPVTSPASNYHFLGYFGYDTNYTDIPCQGVECFYGRRYINSYGELLRDGLVAGMGYDMDATWEAGFANFNDKTAALIKLDSSAADVGHHGQEFLFFEPHYNSNISNVTYPANVGYWTGPYLDIDNNSNVSYTGLMTVGGNNRITVDPADFKRTGYLFAGYFSIPDPGPDNGSVGTRYIDENGGLTQAGYTATQRPSMDIWYAHWCPVGDYVVGEDGNCVESKGFQVTYNCNNNNLGITPHDPTHGYNNDNPSGFVVTTQQSTCLPPLGKKFSQWNCDQGIGNVNAGGTFTIGADTTCTAVWVDANPCGVGYTPSSNSYSWLDDHVNENDIEDGTLPGSLDIVVVPYGFDVHFDYFADFDLDWSCSSAGASASPLLADPLNNISLGANCWCGISRYKDVYGTVYNLYDTQWMFAQSYGTDNQCANNCETLCKQTVQNNAVFRRMMYMSVSSCEAETYTATYRAGAHGSLTGTGIFANDMTYGTDYTVRGLGTDTVNGESGVTAKTGYDFSHWLASNGLSYPEYGALYSNSSSSDFSGPLTFTAQWTPQCNGPVTLDANKYSTTDSSLVLHNVTSNVASVYIKYNTGWRTSGLCTTAASVSAPSLQGYTFGGYYTEKNGGGSQMTNATPALTTNGKRATAAATWYAKWTPKTYTVTYDYGAHAANNATGAAYTHTNGATYDANYTVPAAANAAITPATGYVFVGWNTSSGQTTENWSGATPWTQTTGLTVYAAYACDTGYIMNSNNECVAYTLSYAPGDSNNEASGGIPATGSMNSSQHAGNSVVNLTSNGFTAPTGYNFNGWVCKEDGDGIDSREALVTVTESSGTYSITMPNNNVTCTAQWTPKTYTISYASGFYGSVPNNGADPVAYANGLTYGSAWTTKTFAETGIVADTNYVFSHWNTSADGTGTTYTANTQQSAWTTDSGLTLYAIYGCDTGYTMNSYNECVQQSYTVSFLLGDSNNDGTGTAAEWHGTQFIYNPINGVYYEDLIDLLSYVSEASDYVYISGHEYDYHFDGFKCQTENSGTVLNAGQGGVWDEFFTMPADDVVCTAQWAPNKYSILYGSGSHGSVPNNGADPVAYANGLTYGSPWTTKTFAETGIVADTNYVFSHWNTSADGSGTTYQAGALQPAYTDNTDWTLYAIYDCATGYAWNNAHTQCLKTYDVEYHACASQYLDNNDTTGLLTNIISMINPQYIWGYGGAGLKNIKTGYRFDTWLDANNTSYMNGWYQHDSNQNYYQINLDDNTSPLVLYAQCSANQTNVRYYCGENLVHSDYATYDQSYTFYNNATACGPCVTVTGWNCSYFSKQGTLSNRPYSGPHNVGQTVTWNDPMDDYGTQYGYDCVAVTQGNSYQITYSGGTATNPNNPNSATHAVTTVAMSPQNVHYGDQDVTLNANTYSQEGYNFDGWSCTATICGQQTSDTDTFDDGQNIGIYKFGTNLACTAQWTPEKYTVTYDYGAHAANNATGAAYTHTNGATYDANYTVPAAANAAITPATGYVFVGWNTSSGQTTANWSGATPWTQTTGLTVYAAYACDTANGYIESNDYPGVCVERLTVTYRSGAHGSGQDYVVVVGDGDEHELLDITDVGISAQNGYYFGGWQCDNGVTRGPGYNFVMNGSDVICVAQWTPNEIGLTWLLNSGDWMIDSNGNELSNQNSCDYGTLNGITVYDPVRRGFGFIGWEVEGVSGQ